MKNFFNIPNTLQISALTFLILNVSVVFNVFAFLQIVSYLALGLCILNFLLFGLIFMRKPLLSYFDMAVVIYLSLLIAFTVLNGTDIKNAIYKTIEIVLLMLIVNYKHNMRLIIKTTAIVLSCCVYLNLLIMILFPNWMFVAKDTFDSHLLGGNYNQIGCRLIFAVIVNMLCLKINRRWLINIVLLIIVSIITLALVGSMTSLFCIILYALICIIPSFRLQKMVLVSYFVFFILFQTTIVFAGEEIHNNTFAVYIVEDLLGKDLSFTHRTDLWDSAGRLFSKSPIIGYGYVDKEWFYSNLATVGIGPHNFIYYVLLNGGVVLMSVLIVICGLAVFKILQAYDKIANYLLLGITSLLFMMIMEVYPFFFLFILLYLAYYYPVFISQIEQDTRKTKFIPQA